jgi:hypothetical protein
MRGFEAALVHHPVFDSRSRFSDMRTKAAISGAILLTTIAGASATFLDSYGTISGTADISKAVTISVDGSEVDLDKKTDSDISKSDNMRLLNTTDDSEKVLERNIVIERNEGKKSLSGVDISEVDEISLEIDSVVVDKEDDIQ